MHLRVPLCLALALAVGCGGAPATPPPTDDLVAEGRRLDQAGDHDAAIAIFRQVLDLNPQSFDGHYGIARALDLAGEYDEARQHFAQAIELAPEALQEQARRMMGIAWTFVGNAGEASAYFRQVFDRRLAASNFAGAADEANELGRMYLELGDIDQAETWYRTGHETAAHDTGRLPQQVNLADLRWAHAQARIAARRGRAGDARRFAATVETILDRGGNDDQRVHLAYLLGYIDFQLGSYETALGHLAQADQDDPFILALMAQASEQLGRTADVEQYYRRVLESTSHGITSALARPLARQAITR